MRWGRSVSPWRAAVWLALGIALAAASVAHANEGLNVKPDSFAPHVLTVPGEAMLLDPPGTGEPEPDPDTDPTLPLANPYELRETERGGASWYGARFHRRRTASGELFDMRALTAAHRTLPFGTKVCVRSLLTGRTVVVRINDRGPHLAGRVIDLSQAAAEKLGSKGLGVKQVTLFPMEGPDAICEDGLPEEDTPEEGAAARPD